MLGVTFISGTFVLTDTLNSTFSTLFTSVYSKIDFQVRGVAQFGSGSERDQEPAAGFPPAAGGSGTWRRRRGRQR